MNSRSRSLDKIKLEHAEYRDILAQDLQNVLIREGRLVAKICSAPSNGNKSAGQFVPTHTPERIRLVELRIDPSDRVLFRVADDITVGQVVALVDISSRLGELTANSRRDIERLTEELQRKKGQVGFGGS